MKRIACIFLAEIVLTGMLVTLAGAQSEPLGDYARAVRKGDKKSKESQAAGGDSDSSDDSASQETPSTETAGTPAKAETAKVSPAPVVNFHFMPHALPASWPCIST